MFRDRDHARSVIQDIGVEQADTPLSSENVALLLASLIPQFWIAPADRATSASGATRFGGAPDAEAGAPWPVRPSPADAERTAADLEQHFEWIARHIVRDLPFEFLAQIDLAEAATSAAHASRLPNEGRLQFFWDGVVGLTRPGAEACRVIWDRTPAEALTRLPIPPELAEFEAAYDPEGRFKKPYIYPERAMRLTPILTLAARGSADLVVNHALDAVATDERSEDVFQQLTAMDEGQFTPDGLRGARLQRFLGTPIPEQDDPRFDVIVAEGYAPPPWRGEALQAAAAKALDWQLLLQLDLGDLSQQDLTEGTVYFLIKTADLEARDFSRVHAVYQQT